MNIILQQSHIVNVVAFIDWYAQLLLTNVDFDKDPYQATDAALRQTTRRIARCLSALGPDRRFRVSLRLYHGWYKGFEPMPNRKAATSVVARADFATLSQRANVIFAPVVEFGDHLCNALSRRLHPRLDIHLPNTMRKRAADELEEKMVDTALAADVVNTAYQDSKSWIVVVTEDDDLIPPVFVAESILAPFQSRVVLLRQRTQEAMLRLDDLLVGG